MKQTRRNTNTQLKKCKSITNVLQYIRVLTLRLFSITAALPARVLRAYVSPRSIQSLIISHCKNTREIQKQYGGHKLVKTSEVNYFQADIKKEEGKRTKRDSGSEKSTNK